MEGVLDEIREEMLSMATDEAREAMNYFVPGVGEGIGLRMPQINDLAKRYKKYGFTLVESLIESVVFEERMLAIKILPLVAKNDIEKCFFLIDDWKYKANNWALCDTLGMATGRILVKQNADRVWHMAECYLLDENIWANRLALVLFIHFCKDKTNHRKILALIKPLRESREKYIKKAIVWLEKEIQKYS